MEELELFKTSNEYEISQIIEILKQNNIPYIRRDDGIGSYMQLYMGQSFQLKRIFVSKENYDEAKKLMEFFDFNEDNNKEENEENDEKKFRKMKKIAGFLSLGIVIIFIITILYAILFNWFSF